MYIGRFLHKMNMQVSTQDVYRQDVYRQDVYRQVSTQDVYMQVSAQDEHAGFYTRCIEARCI